MPKENIFNPVPKKPNYQEIGAILDGCDKDNDEDDYLDAASVVSSNLHVNTANAIMEWCNESTIPLDDGETQATRLYVLLLDAAGIDLETDITDDEAEAFDLVCDIAIKYLVSKGVDEADASELIDSLGSNNADDIGDTVFDYICDKLPNDDDAITDDMADFGILDKANGVPLDENGDPILDGVFKKVMAIRGGKKMRVKKRISGSVHLSSKQRAAIKKAGRRAHSSTANMKRMKSMGKRKQMNLKTL